jgi:hypothetical protein
MFGKIRDVKPVKSPEKGHLEPIFGPFYCKYSVIENKLATLYRNQEAIYTLLLEIKAKIK